MPVMKKCECCGKEMHIPPSKVQKIKFCSWDCRVKAGTKIVDCKVCRKKFATKAHKDQEYCSPKCYQSTQKGSKRSSSFSVIKPSVICELCNKEFVVVPSRIGKARFCSIECRVNSPELARQQSEKQSGENHWRWAGGVYKLKHGYTRAKSYQPGSSVARKGHREEMLKWMLEECPNHRFLEESRGGGKKIRSDIEVHHIDRVRDNNARSNLMAVTKKAHSAIHHYNSRPSNYECWPENPEIW